MDKKQETLMRTLQAYCFAAHECALYLDCHPQNRKAIEKHSEMLKKYNQAAQEYQALYGPLTTAYGDNKAGWAWVEGKWPWQNYEPKEIN